MPRKDDHVKSKSKNERSMDNRDKAHMPVDIQSNISNLYKYSSIPAFVAANTSGASNYSDFVSNANQSSDGWYSVAANGIPIIKDIHNALLGRDSAKDYLNENGLSWSDMKGYNDMKLLGRASQGVSGLTQTGSTWLNNMGSDLGKLYSGQKS